jgi:hypothetical protein
MLSLFAHMDNVKAAFITPQENLLPNLKKMLPKKT